MTKKCTRSERALLSAAKLVALAAYVRLDNRRCEIFLESPPKNMATSSRKRTRNYELQIAWHAAAAFGVRRTGCRV
jgi:hypothetical protein